MKKECSGKKRSTSNCFIFRTLKIFLDSNELNKRQNIKQNENKKN